MTQKPRLYARHRRGAQRANPHSGGRRADLTGLLRGLKSLARFSVLAFVGLSLIGASILIYRYVDMPMTVVAVESPFLRVPQKEVEALIGDITTGGFISLDLSAVRERLEAHPWIASVKIRRQWSGRLQVAVVEEIPIARWRDSGFLSQSGQALDADDNSTLNDLPHLRGPEGSSRRVMREFRDVTELLFRAGLKVTAFNVDEHGSRSLRLASGHELILGRGDVIARVRRFLVVWNGALIAKSSEIKTVDARYDNGVAVSWREHDVSS